MTVKQIGDHNISLSGLCGIDDAEILFRLLLENRGAIVDWRRCEELHAAVLQVLLATRPEIIGPPANAFLQERIAPLVTRGAGSIAVRKTG
jgi:hypothetical protein